MAATSIDAAAAAGTQNGMSEKQELAVSWGTSGLLHVGVGLLVLGLIYAVGTHKPAQESPPVIPISTDTKDLDISAVDPGFNISQIKQVQMQELFREVPNPGHDINGTPESKFDTKAGLKGINDWDTIARGATGGSKDGIDSLERGNGPRGRPPIYGPPSWLVPQGGPPIGHGMPAKIVFVLDHSGSMLDTFEFLRDEVKRVVKGFGPSQQFSVVMFSEATDIAVLGPDHLQLALPSVKQDLFDRLDQIRASGRNDDLLEPFTKALGRAFAMKPQTIVFLTDGKFDERLPEEVAKLNKDKKVKINTIAFVHIEKRSQEQLEQIAADNGGKYKFVREADLGK